MPTLLNLKCYDHAHELVWKKSEVPFLCDCCKELGGMSPCCYQCPHKDCNFIVHEECGLLRPENSPLIQKFFNGCDFKFYYQNPLTHTRTCDVCASDIQGFLYQCSYRWYGDDPKNLHPCCAKLPLVFSLSAFDMKIELRRKMKSKCLKCQSRKRSSGEVQSLCYVSSVGKFGYHVACLKEAWLEHWKKDCFLPAAGVIAKDENKSLALQNFAPKEVADFRSGGRRSKAMKSFKLVIMFLKLVFSAIFGEPGTLISTLFQFYQN